VNGVRPSVKIADCSSAAVNHRLASLRLGRRVTARGGGFGLVILGSEKTRFGR
jgi:hypothetical protein